MSDINKRNLKAKEVPFFARYLEAQGYEDLSEEELEGIRGGSKPVTMKAPSDSEDGGGGGIVTMKYPSDSEDGGSGGVVTMKAPSDSDEVVTWR